jgi:GWxTD domain-containing protein
MRKIIIVSFIFIILISWNIFSNNSKPNQESENFLALVKYIIMDEERSVFNEYPPSEREEFIKKFWARRDPSPTTERNEFKEQYFQRMEEANKLFKGGVAGWLQDRGRVYIILGPPDERIINPEGSQFDIKIPSHMMEPMEPGKEQVKPQRPGEPDPNTKQTEFGKRRSETWVYYHPPITSQAIKLQFFDKTGIGNLQLTSDVEFVLIPVINAFVSTNLSLLYKVRQPEDEVVFTEALLKKKVLFNFKWKFNKKKIDNKSNLTLHMEVPYSRILLSRKNDQLHADMNVFMEVRDADKNIVWDLYETYNLSTPASELKSIKDSKWTLDIPVTHWLKKGEYTFYIHLTNLTAGQEVKKLLTATM